MQTHPIYIIDISNPEKLENATLVEESMWWLSNLQLNHSVFSVSAIHPLITIYW